MKLFENSSLCSYRIMGISQIHLLVFTSVLCLTRAQTTVSTTTTSIPQPPLLISYQWPDRFYPSGPAAGDTLNFVAGNESFVPVNLFSSFVYFGRQYFLIYVNSNGLLSFSREITDMDPLPFPDGSEDLIAPLWTKLNDYGLGAYYYQEYTSGDVLTRATQDINQYYPGLSFNATWVFVATWDFVQTWDVNVFLNHSAPSISFQVVLISDGSRSFILMNYDDIDVISFPVEAGYNSIGSTHYFLIPNSNIGNLIPNLTNTTNVNVQGRWAFSANQDILQFADTFYPVGLTAGDTQTFVFGAESFAAVNLSSPFLYFGRSYNLIYVNNNGLLSFNQEITEMDPLNFSSYGGEDLIAPFWTELDDFGYGILYHHEYTSGDVLTRATQDVNRYFPGLRFRATWMFVATWDFVQTYDANEFYRHSLPTISFQVVLISDGSHSFILMNYGDIAPQIYLVEAGYGTVGSTHYFVIPGSDDENLVPNLKYTSNVHAPGRWAFSANPSIVQFSEIFYPVGLVAGDTQTLISDDIYIPVVLSSPFVYFGRAYNQIYVNNNGLLSFSQPIAEMDPSYGGEDLIATLWTDLDDYGLGAINYQEYTSGDVLTRATQDINQYYPGLSFNATWVFVATWDFVQTWQADVFLYHSDPSISVQVILISDGSRSFILMNYGNIDIPVSSVKAGYDTVGSTHYFVIPGSNDASLVSNLKYSSNVHVPGRWAFIVETESVVGLQIKVTSYLDLMDRGNLAFVLDQLKHELVVRGLSSDVQLTARRVDKKNP